MDKGVIFIYVGRSNESELVTRLLIRSASVVEVEDGYTPNHGENQMSLTPRATTPADYLYFYLSRQLHLCDDETSELSSMSSNDDGSEQP